MPLPPNSRAPPERLLTTKPRRLPLSSRDATPHTSSRHHPPYAEMLSCIHRIICASARPSLIGVEANAAGCRGMYTTAATCTRWLLNLTQEALRAALTLAVAC